MPDNKKPQTLPAYESYKDCTTARQLVKYLKADIEESYEEDDFRVASKFLGFIRESILPMELTLPPKAKERIHDEAHQIAQWRGYTVSRDLPEDEILRTRSRLTILEVRQLMVDRKLKQLQKGIDGETLFDYDSHMQQ